MADPNHGATLEAVLAAARDLKYWLDIQKPGALFHPSGGDVRDSDGYKQACRLLDEVAAQNVVRKPSSAWDDLLASAPKPFLGFSDINAWFGSSLFPIPSRGKRHRHSRQVGKHVPSHGGKSVVSGRRLKKIRNSA